MEEFKKQMKRGGGSVDPWAVDFNEGEARKSGTGEGETLLDKAKSYNF